MMLSRHLLGPVTRFALGFSTALAVAGGGVASAEEGKPIAVAEVQHEGPVDFEKEVLPILRRNCLACHNATDAESDLVVETPQSILTGGFYGPAVEPGNAEESLLLQVAAHQSEPYMPPADNDVGAKNLTPEELGILKLWIEQGAKGEVSGASQSLDWQPLPPGVNPIYAVAVSADGQFAAAGRANQIFLYHVPSRRELGRLTDPGMLESGPYKKPGVAHLDLVQSLAFSPGGDLLASGGYRTVKLWRRSPAVQAGELAGVSGPVQALATTADGQRAAIGEESGRIQVFDVAAGKPIATLEGHQGAVTALAFNADGSTLISGGADKTLRAWKVAEGAAAGVVETPAPIHAVAVVNENQQVASGHADNLIRIWKLPIAASAAEAGKEATAAAPVSELKGHGGPVTSLAAIGAAGVQLLSGSQDGTVRVWGVADGKQVRQMNHGAPIEAVAADSAGSRFASVSANSTGKIWNAADGKEIAQLQGDLDRQLQVAETTRSVELAKKHIALAKQDLDEATKRKTAEEENAKKAAEEKKKAEEEHAKKVEAAKKPVADKEAADKMLADAKAAQEKAQQEQPVAQRQVQLTAAAQAAAQAELERLKQQAAEAAQQAQQAAQDQKTAEEAAQKQADNKELAAAADAARQKTLEAEARQQALTALVAASEPVVQKLAADNQAAAKRKTELDALLAKAPEDIKKAEAEVKKLEAPAQKAIDERTAAEKALQVAVRTVERAQAAVERATEALPPLEQAVKTAEEKQQQRQAALDEANKLAAEANKPLHAVAFSPDGATVATAGEDQQVHTWDAATGAALDSFAAAAAVQQVAYTGPNRLLSVAQDGSSVVWDTTAAWQLERVIGAPDATSPLADRVTALDFSSDGKLLASGGGEPSRSGELKIWNVSDGSLVREISEPHSDTIFAVKFSPSDELIASCGADRFVKVFDLESGKFVRSFEGHTHHVLGVAWRADARVLASSGADQVVKVWDARTGDQQRTIQGFGKEVTAVDFLALTDNIVVSAGDNIVSAKNTANGQNIRNYGGPADYMYSVGASADGKTIVAGGQDSVVRIWSEDGKEIATFSPPQNEQTAAK